MDDTKQEWAVDEADIGIRLDAVISSKLTEYTRSYVQKLIKDELVSVNQSIKKSNYKCKDGDMISVEIPPLKELDIQPEDIPLDIVYEDHDVIIVNKPKGLVVHPAAGHEGGTLVNALLYHCKDNLSGINGVLRPGIVHRIDRDTTGLLIICKNDSSHQCIANQLKVHSVTRKYYAIVMGNIKEDDGTVDAPIGRHSIERKKMAINHTNGKRAVTHYKVLERFGQYTLIECQLETGRTHQIRVHMASIHHPLLGDTVYGSTKQPFTTDGQCLHAKIIGFIHPTTKEYMEFDSELPEYFVKLLNRFRNQN